MAKKTLFWHNGACDPLEPYKGEGISEIKKLIEREDIRKTQWSLCNITNTLTLRVICEDNSTYRFFLDWYCE